MEGIEIDWYLNKKLEKIKEVKEDEFWRDGEIWTIILKKEGIVLDVCIDGYGEESVTKMTINEYIKELEEEIEERRLQEKKEKNNE